MNSTKWKGLYTATQVHMNLTKWKGPYDGL